MNEEVERKLYEDWLHQSPEFADTIISAWDVWQARAALAQPEPAEPTPYTEADCMAAEKKWSAPAAPTVVDPVALCDPAEYDDFQGAVSRNQSASRQS